MLRSKIPKLLVNNEEIIILQEVTHPRSFLRKNIKLGMLLTNVNRL